MFSTFRLSSATKSMGSMQTKPSKIPPAIWELLPSEADVAFYEEHGWYVSPKVLSEESVDAAVLAAECFYQGERDWPMPVSSGYRNWTPQAGLHGTRNNEFVTLQSHRLREFALQPIIGAIAARLTRSSQIRLFDDQLVYKPPLEPQPGQSQPGQSQPVPSSVGWHADRAYWATCSSHNLLTAWIPLHDCIEAQGPLVVLDGSHKWLGLEDKRCFNNLDLDGLEAEFHNSGRDVVKIPMVLQKGQMSFHHCWAIHGSYPNRSQQPRLAMALHLQDQANRYQAFWNAAGEEIHIFDERLCRKQPNGDPDFSDPEIFPVLWEEEDHR